MIAMRRWNRQVVTIVALTVGISGMCSASLGNPASSSASYRVVEGEIGGSGQFNSSSTNYSINPNTDDGGSSLGESAVGNAGSTSYQTNSGFNTTAQPGLTMVVGATPADLGVLSTSLASTATATFSVKNYTSWGYVVQIVGSPPTNDGHALAAMTSTSYGDASVNNTEQFGLNVVNNTSPVTVGTNPAQVPSSSFSYGVAGDGVTGTYGTNRPYTVNGRYRFVSGETVASAPKSSGETDYTITFLANMSPSTPGGRYSGGLQIVATGTY